jgi:hypothetical protein
MPRIDDVNQFYQFIEQQEQNFPRGLLNEINHRLFLERTLLNNGGIYFAYEPNELRENGDPRIVRIGLAKGKQTLYERLYNWHLRGNRNNSKWRDHIETCFENPENPLFPVEDTRQSTGNFIELTSFTVLPITPEMQPNDELRIQHINLIEKHSIALLSNFVSPVRNLEIIDPQSANWLGQYATNLRVINSGLWNSNHVNDICDADLLFRLLGLIYTSMFLYH